MRIQVNNTSKALVTLSLVFAAAFSVSCVWPVRMSGSSMKPTINDGDLLFLTEIGDRIDRGNIVSFYPPKNDGVYIARIIGLPGESVAIKDGVVEINGTELRESYILEALNQNKVNLPTTQISEAHYYVLGDNRDNSNDSRSFGTLERSQIEARYYMTYLNSSSEDH